MTRRTFHVFCHASYSGGDDDGGGDFCCVGQDCRYAKVVCVALGSGRDFDGERGDGGCLMEQLLRG